MMRKTSYLIFGLVLVLILSWSQPLSADLKPNFEIGCSLGLRTVINSDLKEAYGNGINYFPNLSVVWKGIILGLGYEGGYKRDGVLGIYEEPAELSVKGPEVFLGYQFNLLNKVSPFIKIGYGFYSYKQVVESEYLSDYPVDGTKSGLIFGGGLKIYPIKQVFISAEVKYGSLKVKPYEDEVDVGGLRLNCGFGIKF
ncbi:MAG: outer membrane beta-barrel protein [Candidatus Saccharicenans sp.]|nr:outer membrane beta-barrel protein [Candidatus Saccharicenans sp.]